MKELQRRFAALACSVVILALPRPTHACTLGPAPDPSLIGTPADGDSAVPTDVVPYYRLPDKVVAAPPGFGAPDEVPGRFALSSVDGVSIGLMPVRTDKWNFELVPMRALDPATGYVLHAEWTLPGNATPFVDEVRFTTGAGPLTEAPPPPNARLLRFRVDGEPVGTCGTQAPGSCVSIDDDSAFVELTYLDATGHEQEAATSRGSFLFGTGLQGEMSSTCFKLRTRAANGTFSDPVKLCGDDSPTHHIRGSSFVECAATGLVLDSPDAVDVAYDPSCTALPPGTRGSGTGRWQMTLLSLLLIARRRLVRNP